MSIYATLALSVVALGVSTWSMLVCRNAAHQAEFRARRAIVRATQDSNDRYRVTEADRRRAQAMYQAGE